MLQPIICAQVRTLLAGPCTRSAAVLTVCLVITAITSPSARGAGLESPEIQSQEPTEPTQAPSAEYLLKAAFLYNFAKFTSWPSSAFEGKAAPIQLCVLGDNPFGAALPALNGKLIHGRPLAIRQIPYLTTLLRCHVLFVSRTSHDAPGALHDDSGGRPMLIVGDKPGFVQHGGMINLKVVDDRVRFEINLASARAAGLKLDTRLLQLADRVYTSLAQNNTE